VFCQYQISVRGTTHRVVVTTNEQCNENQAALCQLEVGFDVGAVIYTDTVTLLLFVGAVEAALVVNT
jgi:hypothetical protein